MYFKITKTNWLITGDDNLIAFWHSLKFDEVIIRAIRSEKRTRMLKVLPLCFSLEGPLHSLGIPGC